MRTIYYTTITDKEGLKYGFSDLELGEFDKEEDLPAFEEAIRESGYKAQYLGHGKNLVESLLAIGPCVLWNLNQGLRGMAREAQIPALCDLLGVTLVGSGTWTALVSQDKKLSAEYLKSRVPGLCFPASISVKNGQIDLSNIFPGPYFIKPRFEGSSRGVDNDSFQDTVDGAFKKSIQLAEMWGEVQIDEYIDGIDISANLACDEFGNLIPLEPMLILTDSKSDTALMKADYTNTLRRIIPMREKYPYLVDITKAIALKIGIEIYAKHYLRIDLRMEEKTGNIFFLEANLTPTLAYHDEFVIGAELSGLSFSKLLGNIIRTSFMEFDGKLSNYTI